MVPTTICANVNSLVFSVALIKENIRTNIGGTIIIPPKNLIERFRFIMLLPRFHFMPIRICSYSVIENLICVKSETSDLIPYKDSCIITAYTGFAVFYRFNSIYVFEYIFPMFLVTSNVFSFHSLHLLCFYGFPVH